MTPDDWRPLFDGLLESVWLVDPVTLRILTVNHAASQLLGMDCAHLVNKPVIELTATPEDQFFWEDVAAGLSSGIHSETLLRGADGVAVPVERRVTRAWLSGNHAVYVVGLRDLRQQRRTDDELERLLTELRATLESTADGIDDDTGPGAGAGYPTPIQPGTTQRASFFLPGHHTKHARAGPTSIGRQSVRIQPGCCFHYRT